VVNTLVERTGYPEDMLEPELDFEADLGIDTIKQAEVLAMVRGRYNLARDESVKIRDLNNIHKVTDYIHGLALAQGGAGRVETRRARPSVEPRSAEKAVQKGPVSTGAPEAGLSITQAAAFLQEGGMSALADSFSQAGAIQQVSRVFLDAVSSPGQGSADRPNDTAPLAPRGAKGKEDLRAGPPGSEDV
jgi:hypothetical protein